MVRAARATPVQGMRRETGARLLSRAALYLAALVVLGIIIIPVLYAALGGFRDTAQLARDPVRKSVV